MGPAATSQASLAWQQRSSRSGYSAFIELVPCATAITFILNPTNPVAKDQLREMQAAALSLGLGLEIVNANTEQGLDLAFTRLAQQK